MDQVNVEVEVEVEVEGELCKAGLICTNCCKICHHESNLTRL